MKKIRHSLKKIFRPRRILITLTASFLLFLLLDYLSPLPPEKSWSTQVLDREGNLLAAYLSPDDKWRMKIAPEQVSEDLKTAIIAKEDQWFFYHPGVNPFALFRALWSNLSSGKRKSGASTITMQVARMLEPKPRTLSNKIKEMFRSLQLEWHYDKAEIMAMYLSYLPYGGNIEGVKAASYIYFDRPPAKLSLAQATLLTVIPNRPNSLRLDHNPEQAQRARDRWLERFREQAVFSENAIDAALAEPVNAQRRNLVPRAPHLSRRLARQQPGSEIHSTLNPEVQPIAERLLRNYVQRVRFKGISNGAVLVLDNQNSEVLAYCGSADFSDQLAFGQVDGVTAVRSPGSTLKPVVYAMGMDQGLFTPGSRMLDIPSTWNGYSPGNYDEKFRGPVTMSYALRHSLNITAVQTLMDVGYDRFLDLLEVAGMESIRKQRKDLGLSVILGGCGVSLEELVRLFSSFAQGGRLKPMYLDMAHDSSQGLPLFSEASAWIITDILSGIERPDLPNDLIESAGRAKIAWKTGTSYGRRDAWSIGFTPSYTIGVWMGNFNGKGVPDLSGSSTAVPLLFDLFGAIEPSTAPKDFDRPNQVWKREVCAETGDLPSANCSHKQQSFYIRNRSPRKICEQEQQLYISPDSSLQFCTSCLPKKAYLKASFPVFPPELTLWYESNKIAYPKPPVHNPDCEATFDGPGPQIISPNSDFEYFIEAGSEQEILLQAASDTRVNRHFWYVDGEFFRSCKPGEKLFFPARGGKSKLSCMDDKGRTSQIEILIQTY